MASTAGAGDTSGINTADLSAVNGDAEVGEGEMAGAAIGEVARKYAEAAMRIVDAVGSEVRGIEEDGVSRARTRHLWWGAAC